MRLVQFWKCLTCWGNPSARGDPASAQMICVQAGSNRADGTVSQTNIRLAHEVVNWRNALGLPICAQGEVAEALKMFRISGVRRGNTQKENADAGLPYIDTHDVAFEHLREARRIGAMRILVIAFTPSHIWRCIWTYERLGFEVIVVPNLPAHVWESGLELWWHGSRFLHYPYELASRLWFLYRGYI